MNKPVEVANNIAKKQWTEPLVILISTDAVQSGRNNSNSEGAFFTPGLHHFNGTSSVSQTAAAASYNS